MFPIAQHVPAITSVRVAKNSCAPMARGYVGDRQAMVTVTVPPIQFNHIFETQIGHQIEYMMRDDNRRRNDTAADGLLHDGAQRRTTQMSEVRMRDHYRVDRRQVVKLHSGLPEA